MKGILSIRLFFLLCVAGTFWLLVMHMIASMGSSRKHADATALILQVDSVGTLTVKQNEKHSAARGNTLSSRLINTQRFTPLNVSQRNENTTGHSDPDKKEGKIAWAKEHDKKDGNAASTKEHDNKDGNAANEKNREIDVPAKLANAGKKWQNNLTNEQKFITNVENHIRGLSEGNRYKTFLQTDIQRAKSRKKGWQSLQNQTVLDSQFLQYLKCPTSVRMKMMSDETVRPFVPETPILAWNEHYSKAEYQRLSNFHGAFGWQNMDEKSVASALAALNASESRYLFDDLLVNGSVPNDKKCIRCAVVGNGGILNGSRMGKEIDANDYVFRVNTALTKRHEKDVGTRTSFYCFTLVTYLNTMAQRFITGFYQPPADEGVRYVFFPNSEWAYSYISATLNKRQPGYRVSGKWRLSPPKFPKQLTAKNIKLVHPDFIRYLKLSWVNSRNKHKTIYRPTTGGIMLLLALHTCDEVNAYGFGGSTARYSDHYYDRTFSKRVKYANHDNDAEDKLWHLLHEHGIINLYTRD